MNDILIARDSIKGALLHKNPTSVEEMLRRLVMWNEIFINDKGFLVGSRPRLDWGMLDVRVVGNIDSWGNFIYHDTLDI